MRFRPFNLRSRIYLILAGLVMMAAMGGVVTVWNTFRIERLLSEVINSDVTAFRVVVEMEAALVNQKGFVTYYYIDGNPDWLRQLGEYRQIFRRYLDKSRQIASTPAQEKALDEIATEYQTYVDTKDIIVGHYQRGEKEVGGRLHQKTRRHFFKILSLCEEYKNLYLKQMLAAEKNSQFQARAIRAAASVGILFSFLLSTLLAFVLVEQVFKPVRALTRETEIQEGVKPIEENEISALSRSVRGLIKDAGETHIELQKSRKHLMASEKMVMLGKLAAGTAHSIRNPLTSVKMRLFSLSRSLVLTAIQQDDFNVISEEIRHIDTIVQNFLEFSRPPRLNMQPVSPSNVVDNAVKLLEHRLRSYGVQVEVERKRKLPEVAADSEQMKEVLVNLIINACEAMRTSGKIIIREDLGNDGNGNRTAVIRLSDTGPGISESMKIKIFEPFFTSKEEGTGLGLSIAMKIVEEHNGLLDVESVEGQGATFIITLPVKPPPAEA
ncbi:sensor histidine kinase [Desulfococcus sp.]|uniref:sensor histidine kinase n=1 Tax=Desulfococcus sp. TaxID=2025834 RepID=UPI003594843B